MFTNIQKEITRLVEKSLIISSRSVLDEVANSDVIAHGIKRMWERESQIFEQFPELSAIKELLDTREVTILLQRYDRVLVPSRLKKLEPVYPARVEIDASDKNNSTNTIVIIRREFGYLTIEATFTISGYDIEEVVTSVKGFPFHCYGGDFVGFSGLHTNRYPITIEGKHQWGTIEELRAFMEDVLINRGRWEDEERKKYGFSDSYKDKKLFFSQDWGL